MIITHIDIITKTSACSRGPKAVLFRLAKFLLDALKTYKTY